MPLPEHDLFPVFQPILDIRKQQAIGYEALIRSRAGTIPPLLFAQARAAGKQLTFDRSCRSLALAHFSHHCTVGDQDSSGKLLFLNVDVSVLDDGDTVVGWIGDQVRASGVSNRQVALEIVESSVQSTDKLIDFVNRYRAAGFLIVLDDFGDSHSNLNRVVQLKPDIIKIDKALIRNIDSDYYKQSIVQTITRLSNKIGAITLAEGVETQAELFACYALGIQLFQGFLFAMPKPVDLLPTSRCVERLKDHLPELNAEIVARVQHDRDNQSRYESLRSEVVKQLIEEIDDIESLFYRVIDAHEEIDCLYLLDEEGIQISDTVCSSCSGNMHALFAPSSNNTDHSFKEYYYYLKLLGNEHYVSEPYISLATGNLCRTVASRFISHGGSAVLCIDFLIHNSVKEQITEIQVM